MPKTGEQPAQWLAYKLNQPLMTVVYAQECGKDACPESFSFASVNAGNVILETVKKAEDGNGTVLRMYESENSYTRAKVDRKSVV